MKEQVIHCGYGWYGLIFPFIRKLKERNNKYAKKYSVSFEEHWGFWTVRPTRVYLLVKDAGVNASGSICEYCGCLGNRVVDNHHWYKTLCPDCLKLRNECNYKRDLELGMYMDKEQEQEESMNIHFRQIYANEAMPEFLLKLSALTNKYKIEIYGDDGYGKPYICDLEYELDIGFWNLKYDKGTG
jgi:hypothetical protein